MECIFDKREYNGKMVEYVVIENDKYLEIPEGRWFYITIDNADSITKHSFRVIRRFNAFHKNRKYTEFYYIDNHTADIDRTKVLLAKLASAESQIAQQAELIEQQANTIKEQSDVIDNILVQLLAGGNQ